MVILRDFPKITMHCLGWCRIMTLASLSMQNFEIHQTQMSHEKRDPGCQGVYRA